MGGFSVGHVMSYLRLCDVCVYVCVLFVFIAAIILLLRRVQFTSIVKY